MNDRNLHQNLKNEKTMGGWGGREEDFAVYYSPDRSGTYKIYLFGEIEDVRQFQHAVEVMDDAGEGDLVIIHLSTNGGSVDATDTFVTAMRRCRARVVVEASGGVYSAGTIILLNAPEFRLSEGFHALIHNGSFGLYDKTSDAKARFEFTARAMDRLVKNTYRGFLSDEEIDQMIAGKDFWMDAEEWITRWKKRQELFKAEQASGSEGNPLQKLFEMLDNGEEEVVE